QMLNQTLSFARPLRLERKPTELAQLLAHVAEQVSALPTMKGMAIDIRCAPAMPPLDLDPHLFGEVLVNLLRNAGEPCGGRGRVEIAAGVEDGRPRIAVTDSGPGVPADLRDEIFKPFYSRKQGGTGLGLAVCRKIVESHGGSIESIELAARPGPGACFRIDLDPNIVLHTEETGK